MNCPHCQSANDDSAITCFTCGQTLVKTRVIRKGSIIASRYEILEAIGKGGMGMVYKAHDQTLDEPVALKVLRPDVGSSADMARRFRSEIKLARKVRHRNVCGIHEYGEDGELRFIAMEFIEGVDLRHILETKGAPMPEEAFEISIQLAEGLQAIHEAGIIHRDLKTPNIMRDSKGYVRLMDFGIAKQAGEGTMTGGTLVGMIVGTPEYMSPEQARGEKVDFRSDIYALGIVLYEIFTGTLPFRGETPIATIFKHLQEPPPLEGREASAMLPASLIPVLKVALAKDANQRYHTAADMAEALKEARGAAFPHSKRVATTGVMPGATAPRLDPTPSPLPGRALPPTPTPGKIPTAIREAVRAAPAVPSPTAVERAERLRVQHLKEVCDQIEGALSRGALDEAAAALTQARATLGDTQPLPSFAARIEEMRRQASEPKGPSQAELLAAAAAEVEALLARGELQGATDALARAQGTFGSTGPLPSLAERLQDAKRQAHENAIRHNLFRVEAFLAADKFEQAQAVLTEVLKEDPRNTRALNFMREATEGLQRSAEEARRVQALAAAGAGIDNLLAQGDLTGATEALTQAQKAYGNVGPLPALGMRLQDARNQLEQTQRVQAISTAAVQIEAFIARDDLKGAATALAQAQKVFGNVGSLPSLATRLEDARNQLEQTQRVQAISAAAASIEAFVTRNDLKGAATALVQAQKIYGNVGPLPALATRLEDLRKQAEQAQRLEAAAAAAAGIEVFLTRGDLNGAGQALAQAQKAHGNVGPLPALATRLEDARNQLREVVAELLARAESLASSKRLEEAQQAVQEALQHDPANPKAKAILGRLEEQRRAEAVAAAVTAIQALLDRKALKEAQAELQRAEKTYGKIEPLKGLRANLLKLEKQEKQEKREQPKKVEKPEPATSARTVQAQPAVARPAGGAAYGKYIAVGGVVLALAGGSVAWYLSRGKTKGTEPSPAAAPEASITPTPAPEATSLPAPSGPGQLVIDAAPWGEVTQIVDQKGKRQPLGGDRFTPMLVTLPPGEYTISVKNPQAPKPVSVTVSIQAAGVERCMAVFRKIDANEYLKNAGL